MQKRSPTACPLSARRRSLSAAGEMPCWHETGSLAVAARWRARKSGVAMKRGSAMLGAISPARLKLGERVCTWPGPMTRGRGVLASRCLLVGIGPGRFALTVVGHLGAAAASFHLAPASPLATGAIEVQQRAFWGGCALADQFALGAAE